MFLLSLKMFVNGFVMKGHYVWKVAGFGDMGVTEDYNSSLF